MANQERIVKVLEILDRELQDTAICEVCHVPLVPLDVVSADGSGVFLHYECRQCDRIQSEGIGDIYERYPDLGKEIRELIEPLHCATLETEDGTHEMVLVPEGTLKCALDTLSKIRELPNEGYSILLTIMRSKFEAAEKERPLEKSG